MSGSGRFQRWRHLAFLAQGLVALGLPFLEIGGESALRLDVPAGRLHAFGASFAVDEAFVVLAATLLVTALFLLLTVALGRAWCGWACPQTVLGELTRWVEPHRGRAPLRGLRRLRRPAGFALVALVSLAVGANLVWWFVSPHEFFARLAAGTLGPVVAGSWVAIAAVVFLDLAFLRATFCATACPYAKLQGVLFDRHSLVVAYDGARAADCVDCGACVRVCPTGIDIRDGLQMECIACARCIDACEPVMLKLRREPDLVGYFFGEPGLARRLARPATIGLAAGAAASLALLVAFVASRDPVVISASGDAAFAARRAEDGRVVQAFRVAVENHTRAPVELALALAAGTAESTLRPDRIALGPGERRHLRLVAQSRGLEGAGRVRGALVARDAGGRAFSAAVSLEVP